MNISNHKNEFQDFEIRFIINQLSKHQYSHDPNEIYLMPISFLINFLSMIQLGSIGRTLAECIIQKLETIQNSKNNENITNHQ
jgi:hypothetical protein